MYLILSLIILSTFLVSAVSLIGITTLSMKTKNFNKIVLILVALSAGALIGGAFLHLIPESLKSLVLTLQLVSSLRSHFLGKKQHFHFVVASLDCD